MNEQTNEHKNGRTERRKLYTPRHKCRGYNQFTIVCDKEQFTLEITLPGTTNLIRLSFMGRFVYFAKLRDIV